MVRASDGRDPFRAVWHPVRVGQFQGIELGDLSLESERLQLRPWRRQDVTALVGALDAESMRQFLALPQPYTKADAARFVRSVAPVERREGTGLDCALVERATGSVVGSATLRLPWRMRACDVGYWIAPAAQDRGYATEAVRVLARWAHEKADVHRVELRLDVRNIASARVALRSGFRFEGLQRDALLDGSDRVDLAVFVHTATDPWEAVPPRFAPLPPEGLSDGTLAVRSALPADLNGFIEQEQDPATQGLGGRSPAPTPSRVLRMLNRARLDHLVGPSTYLSMVDMASERFAGSVRLTTAGPPGVGEVGYAVHPEFRGRGFTARALRLLSAWAFEQGGFVRLELGTKIDNIASQRAALSAGFKSEGIQPGRLPNADGTYSDQASYALLRRDWPV